MAELEQDIAAFEASKDDLEAHHKNKWVIFYEGDLIDAFDTFDAAATEAVRRFGRGPYLIRQVGEEPPALPASVLYYPLHA